MPTSWTLLFLFGFTSFTRALIVPGEHKPFLANAATPGSGFNRQLRGQFESRDDLRGGGRSLNLLIGPLCLQVAESSNKDRAGRQRPAFDGLDVGSTIVQPLGELLRAQLMFFTPGFELLPGQLVIQNKGLIHDSFFPKNIPD